jgi:hypothetical protein
VFAYTSIGSASLLLALRVYIYIFHAVAIIIPDEKYPFVLPASLFGTKILLFW